jgi:hypothetical protein
MYADTVFNDLPVLFGCCVNCDPSFFLQVIDALTRKNQINGFLQISFVTFLERNPGSPFQFGRHSSPSPDCQDPRNATNGMEALDEDRQSTITLLSSSSPATNAFCSTRNCLSDCQTNFQIRADTVPIKDIKDLFGCIIITHTNK